VSIRQNLTVIENNDVSLAFTITYAGAAVNLGGYTLTVTLKQSAGKPDSTGTTFTTSSGLTITNAAAGQFTWLIPHTNLAQPGQFWYRVDLASGGDTSTAMYGIVTVMAA